MCTGKSKSCGCGCTLKKPKLVKRMSIGGQLTPDELLRQQQLRALQRSQALNPYAPTPSAPIQPTVPGLQLPPAPTLPTTLPAAQPTTPAAPGGDGSGKLGAIVGAAGGVASAIEGYSAASKMAIPDAAFDPVGAQKAEAAKLKAKEAAVNNGVATAASAFGPVGMAVGAAVKITGAAGGALRSSNEDEYGLQKGGTGGQIKNAAANIVDPLGASMRAINRFGDDDYSTREKVLGAIPLAGAFFSGAGDEKKRERIKAKLSYFGRQKGDAAARDAYGALYAAKGTKLQARTYKQVSKGEQQQMDAEYASNLKAGKRDFMSSVTGQKLAVQENQQPKLASKPGAFQLENQLGQNRQRGNFDKPYMIVDDRTSQGYLISGDHKITKQFPVITGQNQGEKAAETSRSWRNRPENKGKSFEQYVDHLTATKQRVTPSGEFEVSKKDLDPAAPRGVLGNIKQAVHDSGLGAVLNATVTDSVNYNVRGVRHESYGDRLLALKDPATGQGIGPAVHGTGHQNRLDALKGYDLSARKLSAGCVNCAPEDLQDVYSRLGVGSRVQMMPEDSTRTVARPVLQRKKAAFALGRPGYNPVAESTGLAPRPVKRMSGGGMMDFLSKKGTVTSVGQKPKLQPKPQPAMSDRLADGIANTIQSGAVRATRAVLPINAAMAVQDIAAGINRRMLPDNDAFNRTPRIPLTERDLGTADLQAMRGAATHANPDTNELSYGSYGVAAPDAGSIKAKLMNPNHRMATTIGGAMLSLDGRRVTDSFDFGGTDASFHQGVKKEQGGLFNTVKNLGLYEGVRYLEGEYGSTVDGQGIPVDINLGGVYKPKPRPRVAGPVANNGWGTAAPAKWADGGKLQPKLRPRPAGPAAESTGTAQDRRPHQLVRRGNDLKDPGLRQVFGDYGPVEVGGAEYYALQKRVAQHRSNGAPAVHVVDDPKLRSNFDIGQNKMNLSSSDGDPLEYNYLSELAHAQQRTKMGGAKMQSRTDAGINSRPDNAVPGVGRYGTPGEIEYDAHTTIQPGLTTEYNNAERYGAWMSRASRNLGQRWNAQQQALQPRQSLEQIQYQVKRAQNPAFFRRGGSLIADGHLHSEKHGHKKGDVGTFGVPVLDASTGSRSAEIEREELVLGDHATERLEKLYDRHVNGDTKAATRAGLLLKRELTENTQPSKKYEKRLVPKQKVKLDQGGALIVLGKDGEAQAALGGGNRVFSRHNTRELVKRSLTARDGRHAHALGKRAFTMLKVQDSNETEYASS